MALVRLNTRSLPDSAVTTAKVADNAVTTAKVNADAITNAKIADDAIQTENVNSGVNLGRRNIVINGAMQVAQRNTSQASIGGNTNYWTVDRYKLYAPNTNGRLTMSQDTDTPNGFGNSIKFDCTTADTSIAANEYMLLEQSFEGRDVQQFKKGTSEAKQVTVSFYMKTNKAFTFMCELNDFDNNRVNTQQFTTSTSWTRHIFTFAGDTTGALDNDNARSFGVGIWMHGGSNFSGGTYSANTWQSRQSSGNMRAVGIGSFFDNTDNLVRITGLQMEVGDQVTDFEHRSFGEELSLCQRYYNRTTCDIKAFSYAPSDAGARALNIFFPTVMRAAPSMTAAADAGNVTYPNRLPEAVVVQVGGSVNASTYLNQGYQADSEL